MLESLKREVWRDYHKAVADHGPDDEVTLVLWQRVEKIEAIARAIQVQYPRAHA